MSDEITEHVFRVAKLREFYKAIPIQSIEAFNISDYNKKAYTVFGDGKSALEAIENCCRNMRKDGDTT